MSIVDKMLKWWDSGIALTVAVQRIKVFGSEMVKKFETQCNSLRSAERRLLQRTRQQAQLTDLQGQAWPSRSPGGIETLEFRIVPRPSSPRQPGRVGATWVQSCSMSSWLGRVSSSVGVLREMEQHDRIGQEAI